MADGGADGGDIAHMLHHGSQCDGDDGKQRADKLGAAVDGKQAHGRLMQRDAEPACLGNAGKIDGTRHQRNGIGHQHTNEDGQNFDHALAPDVADNDRAQCHKGQQPVGLAVVDGRGSQDQADGNDDGARDHRREEPHNAADAKGGDEQADDQIEQAGERHACAGIRQHPGVGHGQVAVCIRQHGCHNGEATQIGERRTQERGHFLFGDEVEQQSAQTCAEQSGGNAQPREQGHQNGGTKHGEHVLDAQNQHPARAQLTGIINALGIIDVLLHGFPPLRNPPLKKRHRRAKAAMPLKSG